MEVAMLDVRLGTRQTFHDLTIFPLIAGTAADLPYVLLADAVAAAELAISEIGDGTVPALLARNTGDRAILVLDGEQLLGSRQNRMTNRSILLPAASTTKIPVFCMEQGRWHRQSDVMTTAPQHSPSKMRRRAREAEARHAAAGTPPTAAMLSEAQGVVWADVAESLARIGGDTPTRALDAAYDANRGSLDEWVDAFPLQDEQVGVLAFTAAGVLGLDLIGAPRLFGMLHPRLLRGYIFDAMEREALQPVRSGDAALAPADERAQHYFDAVRHAPRTVAPTVGAGAYHVLGGQVIGGELTDAGRLAHLSAFPALEHGTARPDIRATEPTLAPPSQRRRRGFGPTSAD
jgi:hypothetical protein